MLYLCMCLGVPEVLPPRLDANNGPGLAGARVMRDTPTTIYIHTPLHNSSVSTCE